MISKDFHDMKHLEEGKFSRDYPGDDGLGRGCDARRDHWSRNHTRRHLAQFGEGCFRCNEVGHFQRECPNTPASGTNCTPISAKLKEKPEMWCSVPRSRVPGLYLEPAAEPVTTDTKPTPTEARQTQMWLSIEWSPAATMIEPVGSERRASRPRRRGHSKDGGSKSQDRSGYQSRTKSGDACKTCGGRGKKNHPRSYCPTNEVTCGRCGETGHYAVVCEDNQESHDQAKPGKDTNSRGRENTREYPGFYDHMASQERSGFHDFMMSQDRSVSWGLAGSRGHPKERSPHRASNPKRRTTSREARSPTPGSTGRWEEDVQKGLDTVEEVGAMAATAASGSEKTPRTRRQVKLLTWSQPREPATRLPSPTTPKRSQGPMGWMPPPPPLLPARSSPESTTPLQQMFDYLCHTPGAWPQIQRDAAWWRRIFRDK